MGFVLNIGLIAKNLSKKVDKKKHAQLPGLNPNQPENFI